MDALTEPIEQVVEAGEWFVHTPELRLLYIATSNMLRNTVLEHLTASELLDDNTEPYFVLEAPTEPGDAGWTLRSDELRADWEGLVESAPASVPLTPLWPELAGERPLARFCLELAAALDRLQPPMTGLVIVLAPVWIRDAERWREDLALVLGEPRLAAARFVVVEVDDELTLPVVEQLGDAAERVDARIDEPALRKQMQDRVNAMKNAPPGATGPQLTGAAGPAVAPPPRKSAKPPLTPDQKQALAQEVGIPPVFMDEQAMHQLRVHVVSAATLAQTDPLAAVAAQGQARDMCVANGLTREAVVNELVLGGYMIQAGGAEPAIETFGSAKARAREAGFVELELQAQMAIGAALVIAKRGDEAIVAYNEAGELGLASQETQTPVPKIMAVEAYRMAGQLLASSGREQDAANMFWRALEAVNAVEEDQRPNSSASEAARALASLCRKHGLHQQAMSLDAQAIELEGAAASPATPG
ncbi:hypothetical protein ENSA5_22620 [Enhygromyxa salina]|uniref:Tetratricopeptide repeat protein n=1 Tax=Enhygromyxa salina TaxID=215803 RepID=A0A2S9YBF9_9BACT|nr:hypothetical protein [Enhygromyxa salina]PRQ02444.1 hypothetical protein ENSA5_22620 [Enhygromyxa salina]